jgi:hypothetical protein
VPDGHHFPLSTKNCMFICMDRMHIINVYQYLDHYKSTIVAIGRYSRPEIRKNEPNFEHRPINQIKPVSFLHLYISNQHHIIKLYNNLDFILTPLDYN